MRSLQDEIRQAHQELACPICGRKFELRDIHLRSYGPTNIELSVNCNRSHFPVILLVPVNLKEPLKMGKISLNEVKLAHLKIDAIKESFGELLD